MRKLSSQKRKQMVFFMDLSIMAGTAVILFVLSPLGNGTGARRLWPLLTNLSVWFVCIILFNLFFHTYDSLWRYAEGKEYLALLGGFGCGTALYLVGTKLFFQRQLAGLYMSAVLGMSLIGMLLVRFGYRVYRRRKRQVSRRKDGFVRKTGIIGAGEAGAALLRELQFKSHSPYEPVMVFDDDPDRIGMRMMNVPVRGPISKIHVFWKDCGITDLILAIPSLSGERRSEILNICAQTGCKLHILPDRVKQLAAPASLLSQMRSVQVEDLLDREPITLDGAGVQEMIQGKCVLVTGGGGSIGSELCRQIAAMSPKKLVILDVYENSTYELQQDLLRQYGTSLDLVTEIATVQDAALVRELFKKYSPELVFHAAAHKHVPLMEASPREAVNNNVFGTWNVVRAAHEAGTEKFVLISTDKAVNPTSIMGATKRICEMILSSMRGHSKTEFVTVRFGNVLGSNGSVIPLFQKQIEDGGPVTITDKRIVRYFMTISEAVSLVLQAGSIANGSEVFVLDMGKPVKILNLAENLIRLSGYIPYEDISIVEVGLRPGEKLYEELLVGNDNQYRTENRLIYVENVDPVSTQQMSAILNDLKYAVSAADKADVFKALHRCVPDFLPPEVVNGKMEVRVACTVTPA
ncbi:MAG: nucleoside-diphosphate sugar epimerase/dehydratase [Oscillospiraceae bacterium]|nr:nucleoside-diphosphate sugar epimerase/dehydratase [Oscillospiraceae bacterium]